MQSGIIDVALIQSLYRKGEVKDLVAEYGHVVVDECHHLSAVSFEQVMRRVRAKYVLGLTATPVRKDGHHPIIYMQCGPIRHKLSARSMTAVTPFEHEVVPRLTEFCMPPERIDTTIQEVYAALADDRARNELILADLLRAVGDRRSPLLLTGRTNHLKYFETSLSGKVSNVFVLKGGMGKKQRRTIAEAIAAVPESESRVILATGSYIGEGFDDARLDTLVLGDADFLEGNVATVCWASPSASRCEACRSRLRLRRFSGADAGANVRPAAKRLRRHRLQNWRCGRRGAVVPAIERF